MHAFFGLETVPFQQPPKRECPRGFMALRGGPAGRAGLATDDIITQIEGQPARSNSQLQKLTLTKSPGDVVTVGYHRGGCSGEIRITLSPQP